MPASDIVTTVSSGEILQERVRNCVVVGASVVSLKIYTPGPLTRARGSCLANKQPTGQKTYSVEELIFENNSDWNSLPSLEARDSPTLDFFYELQ